MKKNLILVTDRRLDAADLYAIAHRLAGIDSGIGVHLVSSNDTSDAVKADMWNRPSMTVGFGPARNFVPPRGPIFESIQIPKLEQYKRFIDAGIPTPRTERFVFGKRYEERDWSEFVILKPLPLALTSKQ